MKKKRIKPSPIVLYYLTKEIVEELFGIDYELMDKGTLTSKQSGKIGGEINKRLILYTKLKVTNTELEELIKRR